MFGTVNERGALVRSLKHQILIFLLCSLVILAGSLFVVFGWHMKDRDLSGVITKVQADLATSGEIIDTKYPGSWVVRDGELYKGPVKISYNNDIVDHLSRLTGDTVTIFLGEMRVATTERGSNGERAISTKASASVAQIVLQNGQTYLGETDEIGQSNQAGYVPLRAEGGNVIGMFYVGASHAYEQGFLTGSFTTMIKFGLALIVLGALLTLLFLQKVIVYPLHTIMSGTREAATGHFTQSDDGSGAQEIKELKDSFNQMAEQIQVLTGEINQANHSDPEHDPPQNELPAGIELLKDSEAIMASDPNRVATGPKPEFSLDSPWYSGAEGLPKGLSKVTLDHVVEFLQATRRPLSAEEVAEGVKLTRVTVRHYLEFLEQRKVLKSELRYGTGGRPVKLFILL